MARDEGLEEALRAHLDDERGLTEKPMFGGRAWLLHGHLLCAARDDGVLVRLGKGNERWALGVRGIVPMRSGARVMSGWVRVAPEAFGNDALARKLLDAALTFVRSLPPKSSERYRA
ncbi:MAG: TfoX/Sxy family protein [Labilithrix sp.]|nr:TfoX/Sxy family protein [Labilithrix sp.]